jgi:hypothetical protein
MGRFSSGFDESSPVSTRARWQRPGAGHREFDLAMMRLFGGFGPDCFAAYAERSPLAAG